MFTNPLRRAKQSCVLFLQNRSQLRLLSLLRARSYPEISLSRRLRILYTGACLYSCLRFFVRCVLTARYRQLNERDELGRFQQSRVSGGVMRKGCQEKILQWENSQVTNVPKIE